MEQFSKNVILVDVAFLNDVAHGLRNYMGTQLNRPLPAIDLPTWLGYLMLDSGLPQAEHETQVILVSEEGVKALTCCEPANLESLQGMACHTPMGEMMFSIVTPAGITDSEHLFIDLAMITLDAKEVEHLLLVPHERNYGQQLNEQLLKYGKEKGEDACKKTIQFVMQPPTDNISLQFDQVGYSLLRAMGVKADELR